MEPTEDAASCSSKQLFAVRDVPGKGKGLVATQDIARGTRILCEEPLLRIRNPKKYEGIVAGGMTKQPGRGVSVPSSKVLDPRKRFDLLALHNPFAQVPSMKYLGVIKANGLTLQTSFPIEEFGSGDSTKTKDVSNMKPAPEEIGIFVLASRINHDCASNAHNSWNEKTNRHTVHASRDIFQGEEITINYAGPFPTPYDPREMLRERYGFVCKDQLCGYSSVARLCNQRMLEAHERTESVLGDLNGTRFLFGIPPIHLAGHGDFIQPGLVGGIREMLAKLERNVGIYETYGMDAALAATLSLAATTCSLYGNLSRCGVFWQWAAREWKVLEGEDSPRFIQSMEQALNPQQDSRAAKLMQWATEAGDVPPEIEDGGLEAFEGWLWQRTTGPKESVVLTDPDDIILPRKRGAKGTSRKRKRDKESDEPEGNWDAGSSNAKGYQHEQQQGVSPCDPEEPEESLDAYTSVAKGYQHDPQQDDSPGDPEESRACHGLPTCDGDNEDGSEFAPDESQNNSDGSDGEEYSDF